MNAARELNQGDNSGKLNNLIGYSRELVFTARQMCSLTEDNDDFREVQPLAEQVLAESRDGAKAVAKDRDRFIDGLLAKLRILIKKDSIKSHGTISLIATTASDPEIVDFDLGTLEGMQSNVQTSSGVPELLDNDLRHQFIQQGRGVSLYRAAISLKLPDQQDSDIDFLLSPLPAPVGGTIAPPRLTSGKRFIKTFSLRRDGQDTTGKCKLSPSSLQVVMRANVRNKMLGDAESATTAMNTACACGASPEEQ